MRIKQINQFCYGSSIQYLANFFPGIYYIFNDAGYRKTFEEFENAIEMDKLKIIQINDSKKLPGSRVDRHAHPGKGYIGIEVFRQIVNDGRFKKVPLILEIPEMEKMHKVNIKILKGLLKNSRNVNIQSLL